MGNIHVNLKKEDTFVDITEPFEYVYPETEVIGGALYQHVCGGVYQPEEPIILNEEVYKKLISTYWDLVFHVQEPEMQYDEIEHRYKRVRLEDTYEICFVQSRQMALCSNFEMYIMNHSGHEGIKEVLKTKRLREVCGGDNRFEDDMAVEEDEEKQSTEKTPASGLCCFRPVDKQNRYQGYLKHIQFGNCVGYLIEPGIYYFPENEYSRKRHFQMNTFSDFEKEIAVIAYSTDFHPTFWIAVTYMAIGRENFARLRQIQRTLEGRFLYEFSVRSKGENREEAVLSERRVAECAQYRISADAREVLPGIGFTKVRIGYKYIFCERVEIREYALAYILGNELVLVDWVKGSFKEKKCDLRLLEEVTVRKEQVLNCGVKLQRDIPVIDCKEEKEKEVLTEEAYQLWQEK